MKRILLIFTVVSIPCLLSAPAPADQIKWVYDFNEGMKKARETKLPVMVEFWAIWCGPCKRMEQETYKNPQLIETSKRFIFIQVDVDKDKGTPARYGAKVIPTMVLLDPWENLLMRRESFAYAGDLLEMMKPMPPTFDPVSRNFEILAEDKQNFEALMGIGAFYRQSRFPVAAQEFYTRAVKSPWAREDRNARDDARIALGLLALSINELKEAKKIFEQACKDCDPKNEPFMLLGLGKTYFKMNKLREARAIFEQVASRFPDTEHARVAQDNLHQLKQ